MNNGNVSLHDKLKKQLDPRVKLIISVVVSLMAIISSNFFSVFMYALLMVGLFVFQKDYKIAIKLFLYYVVIFALTYFLYGVENRVAIIVFNACVFLTRMPALFIMGCWFIQNIYVGKFIATLQKLHLPNGFIISLAVIFRFIPTVKSEFKTLIDTMKQRNIGFTFNNFVKRPIKTIEYTIIPMLFRSLDIAEELSFSAVTRGLDANKKRTTVFSTKITIYDITMLVFITTYIVLVQVFVRR